MEQGTASVQLQPPKLRHPPAVDTTIWGTQVASMMFAACERGDVVMFETLLNRLDADSLVHAVHDGTNLMPLHVAAQNGHAHLVERLIARSAPINVVERYGGTPLLLACQEGHLVVVSMLLQHKADLEPHDVWSRNVLHFAASLPTEATLELLLKQKPPKPLAINATDVYGRAPLHLAVQHERRELRPVVLDMLLVAKADVNKVDGQRNVALWYAACAEDEPSVALLLARGADVVLLAAPGDPAPSIDPP
eukprot:CAMPEP_0183460540 /NCGR_PEP_ID=MMETSP0370-20130417/137813_1 /TAXON_ID=268820 /ORGANISM="Peridinium aciculiferum, Strain PAER-2" /LENGTH=249 /DNA_ID=CAMNT_0025652441 /DNA_START=21 /DNA_END=766 /DNA_ORIENTATION=-